MPTNEEQGQSLDQTEQAGTTSPSSDSAAQDNCSDREKSSGSRSGALGFVLLSLVVILLSAAGVGASLFFWQQLQEVKTSQVRVEQGIGQLTADQSRLGTLPEAVTQLKAQLNTQQQSSSQQLSSLKRSVKAVGQQSESVLQKVSELDGANRNDWLIAEVEHYIKLANQRIKLTHDPMGAANLLKQGAEVARAIEVPGVIALREALISDQHALRQVANIDVEGVYIELSVLSRQLEKLVQPEFKWAFKPAPAASSESTVLGGDESAEPAYFNLEYAMNQWARFFKENLVRVRKVDEPITALTAPDELAYLQQNLRLLLSQAQLAVMRGEGRNFQVALQQASDWIQQHYDKNDAVTQDMVESLGRLLQLNIQPQLPEISASLNGIRELRDRWNQAKQQALRPSVVPIGGAQ